MKRTILLLVVAVAMVLGAKAQQQTATLQRGNSTTYYYGADAFKEAYNAANDGSIITLSAGHFNTVDSVCKQITIRGNGYTGEKTVIGTNQFEDKGPYSLFICTDNVKMDGLYLEHALTLPNRVISGLKASRCFIHSFLGPYYFIPGYSPNRMFPSNTIIDQCKIGPIYQIFSSEQSNNCIKNSYINGLSYNCNNLYILDSVLVLENYDSGNTYRNCIILCGSCPSRERSNAYYNNVFVGGITTERINNDGGSGFYYSVNIDESTRYSTYELDPIETANFKGNSVALFDDVFNYTNEENPLYAPIITTITGDDGTVVGPYGGTGFSEHPAIPRITESKIDSYTDGEGKLNVKVKVEVGQ